MKTTFEQTIQETLYFIAQNGWSATGDNFFNSLALFLSEKLKKDYVIIDKLLADKKSVDTIVFVANGKVQTNVKYDLLHTPCENVIGKQFCAYHVDVQQLFPLDTMLVDMQAMSYAGIPLWDTKGNPIGLIALLDKKPIKNIKKIETILQIVAVRVAHEIERTMYEEQLLLSNKQLAFKNQELIAAEQETQAINEELRATNEELQKAKDVAEAGEVFFNSIAVQTPDIIYLYDLTTESNTYINKNLRQLLGYKQGEVPEDSTELIKKLIHPDDVQKFYYTNMLQSWESEYIHRYEYRLKDAHGKWRWFAGREKEFKREHHKIVSIIGLVTDVTQQKEVEQQLIEAKEYAEEREFQLNQIANNFSYGMIYQVVLLDDTNRQFTYISQNVEQFHGCTVEQAKQDANLIYQTVHPDDIHKVIELEREVLKTMSDFKAEIRIVKPDNTIRWVYLVSRPRRYKGLIYWDGIEFDITEQKNIEQELSLHRNNLENLVVQRTSEINQLNTELRTINDDLLVQKQYLENTLDQLHQTQNHLVRSEKMAALGVLLAGIAHEINNPINFIQSGIVGFQNNYKRIETILNQYRNISSTNPEIERVRAYEKEQKIDFLVEMMHKMLQNMETGAKRTTEIVKGLRAFAHSDEKISDAIDIHQSIDNSLVILQHQYKDRITIKKEYGKIPKIACYPAQINQVFMNILNNAIHAIANDGYITIATRFENNYVRINISDTGIGISSENLNKIFDPFFTTKEVGQGTGLGLSITYNIVKSHNGKIEVQSTIGEGTTFSVFLPLG